MKSAIGCTNYGVVNPHFNPSVGFKCLYVHSTSDDLKFTNDPIASNTCTLETFMHVWQHVEIETYKHIKLMPIGPEISMSTSMDPVGGRASAHTPGQAQAVVSLKFWEKCWNYVIIIPCRYIFFIPTCIICACIDIHVFTTTGTYHKYCERFIRLSQW